MKNCSTNLFNASFYRLLKGMVIVCLLLSYATSASAKGEWTAVFNAHAKIANSSTASGKVFVSKADTSSPTWETDKNVKVKATATSSNTSNSKFQTFYWYAEAGANSVFAGWYSDDAATGDPVKNIPNFNESLSSNNDSETLVEKEYFALFKTMIDPVQSVIDWTKTEEKETYSTTVNLYKANNFHIHSIEHVGGETRDFRCDINTLTADYANLVLTAGEDVGDGDQFIITLFADNGGLATITVNIKLKIEVTFLSPTLGKGSYKAIQTNAGGVESCNLTNGDPSQVKEFNKTNQFFHTFIATPHDDYNLHRWVITHEDASSAYLYPESGTDTPSATYTLQDGDIITAEFLPKNMAQFVVKGVDNAYYHRLDDAIEAAKTSSSKIVVVHTSGTLYNEDKPLSGDGKYEFTIPSGITLLVPGDAANTVVKKLRDEDYSSTTPPSAVNPYKELTLAANTRIICNGDICVYAKISNYHAWNGTPINPGIIHMGDNTEIVVNSGASLAAYGYITGNHNNSQVIAKKDASVYEAFQFRDWRGGTVTAGSLGGLLGGGMIDAKERVFPFSQYYIQNIETKLILQYGATAYGSSAAEISYVGNVRLTIELISKDTDQDDDKGIFCIGENTQVLRWYDSLTDRQMYNIESINPTIKGSAKIGVIYTEISGKKVDSRNYVLPITNNMDITFDNVNVVSKHEFALLPGSQLAINSNASLTTESCVFIYDKEYLGDPKNGNQGFCFYNPNGDVLFKTIHYTVTNTTAEIESIRTADKIHDAKVILNGVWNVNDGEVTANGMKLNAGVYTTGTTEDDDKIFGADITSTGGGKMIFNVVSETTKTYQYHQTGAEGVLETYVEIPVTNARLRNADGGWSAGHNAKVDDEYIYSKGKKRWVLPQVVSVENWTGHEFLVRLPEPNTQSQNLVIKMITKDELDVNNFGIILPSNSYFTKGDPTYDKEKKQLIIPITYKISGKHNIESPNTQEITIVCYDINLGGELDRQTITLSAVEDYTPNFTVAVGDKDVTTDKQYTFAETAALNVRSVNVVITPDANTVASLPSTTWQGSATTSPTFTTTGSAPNTLAAVYTPQEAGNDAGTLTITATYTDAASKTISHDIVINLNGTGLLQDNTLAFQQYLIDGYTIIQGMTTQNIFANMGNGNNVTFTYTYVGGDVDGQDASALVTVSSASGNYTINANEVETITETRNVKVIASQTATSVMNKVTREIILTVLPPAIWNWSDLYFGQTYNNPVTPSRNDAWTLTEIDDPNDMVGALQGDYTNYSAVVATGDLNTVYEAKFKFIQEGGYEKVFTSKIYADPRVLGFCVDASHEYKGITNSAIGGVSFDDTNDLVSLKAGAQWVIQMIGMPDKMTFTTNGENLWNIEQRASESSAWSAVATWTQLSNGEHTFSLLPTTRFVRITYGSTNPASIGQLSNVCVSKLSVQADIEELYLPIHKDGSNSSKTIVLTHTEANTPELSAITGLEYNYVTTSNLGTAEEPYYQTTLTITVPSTFAQGTYTLTAKQGTEVASIPVYADYFPQGLPIKLATDDVKRYHFVSTISDNVSWDATTKQVVLQNPGGSVARSVVLAFEGAPSRISFTASRNIIDSEWRIYESVDGTDGSFVESSLINRDTEAGATFTHNLQYTTRYVRIYYYSDNQTELRLSDLVIEGDPMLLVNPKELEFSEDDRNKSLTLTAINLSTIRVVLDNTSDFRMNHGSATTQAEYTLTPEDYPDALGINKVGDIVINTEWISSSKVNDGIITIYNVDDESILAKVKLVGAGKYLKQDDASETGIYTGIPDGTRDINGDGVNDTYTFHGANYEDYTYHQVNLSHAFAADGTALFDVLFVYGETTTTDGTSNITAPAGEEGSNARTPYYVYVRDMDAYGNFDRYRFVTMVNNVNEGEKVAVSGIISSSDEETTDEDENVESVTVKYINVEDALSVYITGFAPYATTGYTKGDEGVFFFRGNAGDKLDIYLEDAHIFARNKMENGQPFYARGDHRNPTFSEGYARGSGGVLVFECQDVSEQIDFASPFEVSIHTIGNNLLKSNYGCFNYFFGMDPFQISAPIHVRLHSEAHLSSKTELNFDDIWPTELNDDREITASKRTNGFLGLKKLNNNAPSIDLGNPHTVVNFRGGQVQLQNAQIVSTNYKTTLAISYRAGEYGGDNVGLKFAEGIGTDDVGGTVNFYDGTITVEPMWVKEEYKNYYFIDKDGDGNEIKKLVGSVTNGGETLPIYEYQTSCLRCPENTHVYGGSICWLRACQHVTSKGGAPMGGGGVDVGQYIYTFNPETDVKDENTKLVTTIYFPNGIAKESGDLLTAYLATYYPDGKYGLSSITPDANNQLYFWIPEGYGGVTAEKDKFLTTWKACMTEISAEAQGIKGTVGGNTPIERNEEIKYMLYCQIDQKISDVITAKKKDSDEYKYEAPVKVPQVAQSFYGGQYTTITPSLVGKELQNEVTSSAPYEVTDKVYYITIATADVWQTFTAPFDVAKIWVVETYSETELEKIAKEDVPNSRENALLAQAEHNADFAAFYGVAMAIGTSDPLENIFADFVEWGRIQDQNAALYNGTVKYDLRGKYELVPYNGSNWSTANFYLNHNVANWSVEEDGEKEFSVEWVQHQSSDMEDGIMLHKGETYSILLPYCTGCFDEDGERDFWDYWSGKFLIFESVDHSADDKVHIIEGSDYLRDDWTDKELATNPTGIFIDDAPTANTAKVTGNSTFAFMTTSREDIYTYVADPQEEWFKANVYFDKDLEDYVPQTSEILPTTAFLWANISTYNGMPARGVKRTGEIIYPESGDDNNNGNQNGTTGGHIPTVGGGNDLFITSIAGGINVAVAAPQNVRVLSSTGAVIYSGYVTTAVDIQLPTTGIYIVSGENEVQKILF